MSNQPLGVNLFVAGYCVVGHFSPTEIEARLIHLIEKIGMDTGGMPADIRIYPLEGGQGGTGSTIFQPLVESASIGMSPAGAMIGDTWHDFKHTYFLIASCKEFSFREVGNWLQSHVGDVISSGQFRLTGPQFAESYNIQSNTDKLLRACN